MDDPEESGDPNEVRPGPWALPAGRVLEGLSVTQAQGLGSGEVAGRLAEYGRNILMQRRPTSPWRILASQFKSVIVLLLAVAAAVSFLLGDWLEGIAIVVVIGINSMIGFSTELRAVRSMEALRTLGRVQTKVRRDGELVEVPADELVPGDIVILEGGDVLSADLRVLSASKMEVDESMLTGESMAVGKDPDPISAETALTDRTNMLYKGTAVTRGSGEGVVVATGMQTELGRISSLVEEAKEETTPLEKRLDLLGRKLIWATIVVVAVVAVAGILSGRDGFLMLKTAIALAVATIPEGLPIVATIALARGVVRMARRNALINQLSAVETLGGTTVICTDKTGTLTENKMTVVEYVTCEGIALVRTEELGGSWFERDGYPLDPLRDDCLEEALEIGVLCNNASLEPGDLRGTGGVGDPLEIALLAAGAKAGIVRGELVEVSGLQKVGEEAFDSDVKMMATFHRRAAGYLEAVKGAPEVVLKACTRMRTESGTMPLQAQHRDRIMEENQRMGENGLRVLALANRVVDSHAVDPYEDLVFVALVGLKDPPRRDVSRSIASCTGAGIRVVMATGDQAVTARNVALEVGLVEASESEVIHGGELRDPAELAPEDRERMLRARIFARVSPKQKLDLIALHQGSGQIVAMTGDGVNDAPALKKADIGVAMGLRGTEVAREASDMVLKDDSFSTIVSAVEQGRAIFDNIRKVVLFLLSCNISEIMVVGIASILNAPLPLLPLQILFLNLVTDVFPALALGTGEGDPAVMKRPPRNPKEGILRRNHWILISAYGITMTLSVLAGLYLALHWLGFREDQVVTVSFLTLAFAQLWHVFNMRDPSSGVVRNEVTRNPWVWASLGVCAALLFSTMAIPGLSAVMGTAAIGADGWILVVAMSLVTLVVGQIYRLARGGGSPTGNDAASRLTRGS